MTGSFTPLSVRAPFTATLLAALLLAAPARAQGPGGPPPEIARAQAAMRAGQPDSAIAVLEGYYRANSSAMIGRIILGNAYRAKKEYEKAIAAYDMVRQPPAARMTAVYSIATVHARTGNADLAFQRINELKASGSYDMDLLRTDAEFATLRGDARFEAAMFHPAEFGQPFVEPARIIHEWVGEAKGDQFSWIARGIGDVDRDGVTDIVTSAPTHGATAATAAAGTAPGKIYLYSGKGGRLLWAADGSGADALGNGIEGAGDVNRDGIPDVIAGAPGGGRAMVYSGNDGRVLLTLTGTTAESFGQSASSAGDQDGDGYADLLVGAPAASAKGAGAGRAYVYSGRDGKLLRTLEGAEAGDGFGSIVAGDRKGTRTALLVGAPGGGAGNRGTVYIIPSGADSARFRIENDSGATALGAMFTSIIGDVDGDKVKDFYASDFAAATKGPSTGEIYVHSGATGKRLLRLSGEHAGDGFGIGSAEAGDVNGDGHDDLVLGAWQYSAVAPSGGKIYLYSGKDGALLRAITGRIAGETLGFDATGVGDVDGDGKLDLLVTSSWSNKNGYRAGRMYVIAGR